MTVDEFKLAHGTPVEDQHSWFWVKREDLCSRPPWPPFSKVRGVLAHVRELDQDLIGVLDTFHSRAGWAVAAACSLLGKRCINYWPKYKADSPGTLREPQLRAYGLGAELVSLQAGRSAVLFHQARKLTERRGGYMMPNALKLEESVEETAKEVIQLPRMGHADVDYVVIPASSGTIAAGVLRGFVELHKRLGTPYPRVIIHLGYTRSHLAVMRYLASYAPDFPTQTIQIIDERYSYKDKVRAPVNVPDFACNEYYDLKAWTWLHRAKGPLAYGNTLFWNIG